MTQCEVCLVRPAKLSVPSGVEKDAMISMCLPCVKQLFEQAMAERRWATLQ